MPLYMTQVSYTNESWAAQVKNPVDRSIVLKALFEKFGGRLISMYYCSGDYDAVIISEFPNETEAMGALFTVLASSHLRRHKTTDLYEVKQGLEAMAKAGKTTYSTPSK